MINSKNIETWKRVKFYILFIHIDDLQLTTIDIGVFNLRYVAWVSNSITRNSAIYIVCSFNAYKRESHMWQISVIDLLNAGEIWTRSISCGVSEGRGRGTNKKKEDITTSEVYLFMQRCSSLYDAVFRQWWCINSCPFFNVLWGISYLIIKN